MMRKYFSCPETDFFVVVDIIQLPCVNPSSTSVKWTTLCFYDYQNYFDEFLLQLNLAKADIWSLGITALELATGQTPYGDLEPMKALMFIMEDEPPTLQQMAERCELAFNPAFSSDFDEVGC